MHDKIRRILPNLVLAMLILNLGRAWAGGWLPEKSRWIWAQGAERPPNGYVCFRRNFAQDGEVQSARLRVTADSRYIVYLNGRMAGRGPVLTEPRFKQFDEYDVTDFVRRKANCLAALVLHRGSGSYRVMPARGGLLAQLEIVERSGRRQLIGTDTSWRSLWADAYRSDAPLVTFQFGLQEWFDARKMPPDWTSSEFDDSGWDLAAEARNAAKHWPAALEPRQVPHLDEKLVRPRQVITWSGFVIPKKNVADEDPARQIEIDYPSFRARARGVDSLTTAQPLAEFRPEGNDGIFLVLDFGRVMLARPTFEIDCQEGVTVDLAWGETLALNRVKAWVMEGRQRYAERYITREGRQRHEAFEGRGFRYLQLNFRRLSRPLKIYAIGAVESRYPVKESSEFVSSDQRLNRIAEICKRTVEVCLQENFVADIKREQNQWIDPIQTATAFYVYGGIPLLRQYLDQFAKGQYADGMLPSAWPRGADCWDIPWFGFSWVTLAHRYWMHTGDTSLLPQWLDTADRLFEGSRKYRPGNGLMNTEFRPYYNWAEWEAVDHTGVPAIQNAWLVLALRCAGGMAHGMGQTARANRWRREADDLDRMMQAAFWSEARGAYVDSVHEGRQSSIVSQQTTSLMAFAGIGTPERLRSALRTILRPGSADVPLTMQFRAYHNEGRERLGLEHGIIDDIRARWGRILDLGATTTWETEKALELDQSLCHPWTSHPLPFLLRQVLGVSPASPGFRTFSVRVNPMDLTSARGKVVTPKGPIRVSWQKQAAEIVLELVVPSGTTAHVTPPLGWQRANVMLALDASPVTLQPLPVADGSFATRIELAVSVPAGRHRLRFVRTSRD